MIDTYRAAKCLSFTTLAATRPPSDRQMRWETPCG